MARPIDLSGERLYELPGGRENKENARLSLIGSNFLRATTSDTLFSDHARP